MKKKHLASLRSLCEGIDTGKYFCLCGEPIESNVHYNKAEIKIRNLQQTI